MIFILSFSGSVGIKLTYSAGILIGIQNPSCVPFPHGVYSMHMSGPGNQENYHHKPHLHIFRVCSPWQVIHHLKITWHVSDWHEVGTNLGMTLGEGRA